MTGNHRNRSKPARVRRERIVSMLDRIVKADGPSAFFDMRQFHRVPHSLIDEARRLLAEESKSTNGESA